MTTECICIIVGREIEHRRTNPKCFQHGSWSEEDLNILSLREQLLYGRYRAPYFPSIREEAEWWFKKLHIG